MKKKLTKKLIPIQNSKHEATQQCYTSSWTINSAELAINRLLSFTKFTTTYMFKIISSYEKS